MKEMMVTEESFQSAVLRHRNGIARSLRDGLDATDPEVRLVIEAVAVASARAELLFEGGLPELGSSFLEAVFPGRTAPVPPMSMFQIEARGLPPEGLEVPRGAVLEARPDPGREADALRDLRFSTGAGVVARPIAVTSVRWTRAGGDLALPPPLGPAAALVMTLESVCGARDSARCWSAADCLRFYVHSEPGLAWPLLEALARDLAGVVVRAPGRGADAGEILDPSSVTRTGLGVDDLMLPDEAGSFPGYQLLREFFLFPARFQAFTLGSLAGAASRAAASGDGRVELVFAFSSAEVAVAAAGLTATDFRLNAVPVINAFEHLSESHQLRPGRSEYELVPDPIRHDMEILRLDKVQVFEAESTRWADCRPLHGYWDDDPGGDRPAIAYHATRRDGDDEDPCDVLALSLTAVGTPTHQVSVSGLRAYTLCSNRNLAAEAPLTLDFQVEGHPGLRGRLLARATPSLRRPKDRSGTRRLPTHLSFHTLAPHDPMGSAAWLRRLLADHGGLDLRPGPGPEAAGREALRVQLAVEMIGSIRRLSARTEVREHPEFPGAFINGRAVTIDVDSSRLPGGATEILGSVLSEFLADYCSTNSFTRLAIENVDRPGRSRTWATRAGRLTLR